ncbi:hypothetical protein L6164_002998 [Bauhinia variegata]|uniref:Uncharacterized protein n=1 Tax=Bauhinia variegata TaxID=167791 RepID=A0ACB9Q1F0_BAUVA|nr:hypothetical protein L6164_002998 [Bauhinia variegata]
MDVKEAALDISHWDGTLSLNDFSIAASAFSEKWKRFNPGVPPWSWVPCPKQHLVSSHRVEGYLQLENFCCVKSSEKELVEVTLTQKAESGRSNKEECFDYATLVCSEQPHEVIHYDFHIVYSASYRVPVLYFRAYHTDGQPLLFNDIEKDLPGNSAKLPSESKWTFITQEEHPYLNRPWYKLHPCGTGEWMKLLFLGDPLLTVKGQLIERYLVSWFSVVGQVVGLKLPLGMLDSIVSTYSCTNDEKNGNTEK